MNNPNAKSGKFDFLCFFGSFGTNRTNQFTAPTRYIIASVGIHKVGCIIVSGNTGPRKRISVTLAGRLIGFTELSAETRKIGRFERSGLSSEVGTFGTIVNLCLTRYKGKNRVDRTKRFTVPSVKIGKSLWPGLIRTFRVFGRTITIG